MVDIFYFLKPTLGPPKKFEHLTRAEEVVITRLQIGHTEATKSHILSRGPPTACQHCGQTLTIEHMLLECTVLQQIRDKYYTADSLRTLFETIPDTCIVEFLREAGIFYLIWKAIYPVQHINRITHQLTKFGININLHILTPLDSCNLFIEHKQLRKPYLWKRLICLWGCVSSVNKCNPIKSNPDNIRDRACAVLHSRWAGHPICDPSRITATWLSYCSINPLRPQNCIYLQSDLSFLVQTQLQYI